VPVGNAVGTHENIVEGLAEFGAGKRAEHLGETVDGGTLGLKRGMGRAAWYLLDGCAVERTDADWRIQICRVGPVVVVDRQSVKTTERGVRGFDAHKRVKRRKRHILIDALGLLVANRVESADTSYGRAGALLLGGLSALFPRIRTVT
jgi:hypothetical protein